MKYSLPSLKAAGDSFWRIGRAGLALAMIAALVPLAAAQQADSPPVASGQELVARASALISQTPSLEAKVRQRVSLLGQELAGSGYYVQLRHPGGNQFRFDLRMQAGEQLTSFQHHNDGTYLWIRRDADGVQSLSRVALERVREARREAAGRPNMAVWQDLGVGGLAQLLQGLNQHFEFGAAGASEIGGVPVWQMSGLWKRESLLMLLPHQADAIRQGAEPDLRHLPQLVPHSVSLVLGRDAQIPLFPYRVEYSRRDPDSGRNRLMLRMELHEVRLRPDLDARQFRFELEDEQRVEDETDAYLRKLQLLPGE
jgi:outer membrane lipoprotein-sorting protein